MKKTTIASALGLITAGALLGGAESSNAPSGIDTSSFKIISEIVDRNIFNPRRYSRSSTRVEPVETPKEPKIDSFALVGVMLSDEEALAFFDGSSSEYRKVLKLDETIADYKVAGITHKQVTLVSGTNEVTIPVGMQLRREDEGPWALKERSTESFGSSRLASSSGSAGGSSATGSGSSSGSSSADDETDPVVKRLMEKKRLEESGAGGGTNK